jgi:hypothetical protein
MPAGHDLALTRKLKTKDLIKAIEGNLPFLESPPAAGSGKSLV